MRAAMEASPVTVDVGTPRSLDSPVIKADTKGRMVVAALCSVLAMGIAAIPTFSFDWVMFSLCAVADIVLLTVIVRVIVGASRTRRVWRYGTLVEVKVRASSLAWKDFNGGAYTLELEIAGGSTLTFDYSRGQPAGASFPALVQNGWILVLFSTTGTPLKRLAHSRVSR